MLLHSLLLIQFLVRHLLLGCWMLRQRDISLWSRSHPAGFAAVMWRPMNHRLRSKITKNPKHTWWVFPFPHQLTHQDCGSCFSKVQENYTKTCWIWTKTWLSFILFYYFCLKLVLKKFSVSLLFAGSLPCLNPKAWLWGSTGIRSGQLIVHVCVNMYAFEDFWSQLFPSSPTRNVSKHNHY